MKKRTDEATTKNRSAFPLHLAVATVTLGMTMGVSPGEVMAEQPQIEQDNIKIAAAYIKKPVAVKDRRGDVKEQQAVQKPAEFKKPETRTIKVQQQETVSPEVQKPGKAYPKFFRPTGTQQHKR